MADILPFPNAIATCKNCYRSVYEDDPFYWFMMGGVGLKYLCKTCMKDDCAVCDFFRFAKKVPGATVFDRNSKPVVLKYKNPLLHDHDPH